MPRIVAVESLTPDVTLFRIDAPKIARRRRAGQFVIVRLTPDGERIPLTIASADRVGGTITLVVQAVGKTTMIMHELDIGDEILDLAGPLGRPSEVAAFGTVVVVGGGVGTAVAYPIAVALSEAGNRMIAVIGARSRPNLFFEEELRVVCDDVLACTDDGSYGRPGMVTDALADLLAHEKVDRVIAAGPVPMMQAVAETTRRPGITTIASLNPIMIDGTGMCGGCRVSVGGENRFACLDGPEFDAHQVDFDLLALRNRAYLDGEAARRDQMHECVVTVAAGPPEDRR
jgi:ferredoxin/flavodoxin---NADP+ reductase